MATIRARQLDSSTLGLAVWDKSHGDGEGGTETAVMRWRQRGIQIELLNPVSLGRGEQGRRRPNPAVAQTQRKEHARGVKVMTLLFADAVGFSKLTEFQVPLFVEHVLGSIARLAKGCRQIAARNTWGDGIFFVFRTAEAAADFALSLVDLISSTDWQKIGLPGTLSMRVALHAGPVYKFSDPIMGRPSFGGTHVSRAARIEPITPPGQVYASEAFACLAVAHGCDKIAFDYAGQTPMAKDFGTFPTYHVRRAGKFSVSGAGPIPS